MDTLTERGKMVLGLIMESYIHSAEPIGSRTIARSINETLSSATIRNVMADLEEQGYLYKPTVVAGRIPTYKAFRHYVDSLPADGHPGKRELHALESLVKPRYSHVEGIMEDASRTLASISHYMSIVVEPKVNTMLFKEVEFVQLSRHTLLMVFVTSSGMVHTRFVEADEDLDMATLDSMKRYMNERFSGMPFNALKDLIIQDMQKDKDDYRVLSTRIKETLQTIMDEEGTREIYMDGASKMIGVPEFSDIAKLKELFQAFEKKEALIRLLDKCLEEEGIHVIIGSECDIKQMRDMSIITSTYRIGEKSFGALGVIGPVRMNYSRIIPIVNHTAKMITDILATM
jgi:heat-inducible transcriptional repressor